MTTSDALAVRRLAANLANAERSTGPKSVAGKLRSRRNALKHGLTAVTVVDVFECARDYDAFEQAILAEYMPSGVVERELAMRLASLLWRLRRVAAVETGLLQIHAEIQRDRKETAVRAVTETPGDGYSNFVSFVTIKKQASIDVQPTSASDIARCFLRLTAYDNGLMDRVGRYERALWRQVKQLTQMLERIRRRALIR